MDPNETAGPSSGNSKDKETVKVVVRCRPLFGKELVEGRKSIVTLDQAAALISLKCPDNGQIKSFTFDSVYDENTSQRNSTTKSIFDGYNGTIFAYGQTGCGKTHTMQGKDSPPELRGVIPLSFDHIFDTINADTTREYMLREYKEEIERLRKMLESQTQSRGNELGTSSRMGTPSRPLSSSNSADLAKERQEIAKYQQEAAEMLERAKWMMDEAKALQAQNQPDPAKDQKLLLSREKEMLHAKLKKIESHILGGRRVHRRRGIKLREKAKKQAKNEAMRRALELEKHKLKKTRKKEAKYKANWTPHDQEIADLNSEFERERENLLDTIREQTKESKLLEQLVELFLPQNELVKVWERAVDFHMIKLPTLGGAGIESGGAEVVSEEEVNGRQGSAGATSHVTVRSLGSSSSTKRRKSSVSSTILTECCYSPYEEGFTSQTPATTARLPSAIHTSRPDGKAALVSRGMSPHNSSNGSKERRKIKEKSSGTSGLPVSQYQRQPQDQEPQLASAYEAPGASHYFPGDDDLLTPLSGEYQPRDRLQSRQGSRQDSRQRSGSISGNSRAGLGQLEHTPPAATVEKTRSSSRGDSGVDKGIIVTATKIERSDKKMKVQQGMNGSRMVKPRPPRGKQTLQEEKRAS
ncbi:Kinesin-like protein [Phytophthora cactorum]|nr:Kinesin-like protein [Phytophthora cactorum]